MTFRKSIIFIYIYSDVSVKREIRENEDCILHYTMGNLKPRDNLLGDDFVVLASTRKDIR